MKPRYSRSLYGQVWLTLILVFSLNFILNRIKAKSQPNKKEQRYPWLPPKEEKEKGKDFLTTALKWIGTFALLGILLLIWDTNLSTLAYISAIILAPILVDFIASRSKLQIKKYYYLFPILAFLTLFIFNYDRQAMDRETASIGSVVASELENVPPAIAEELGDTLTSLIAELIEQKLEEAGIDSSSISEQDILAISGEIVDEIMVEIGQVLESRGIEPDSLDEDSLVELAEEIAELIIERQANDDASFSDDVLAEDNNPPGNGGPPGDEPSGDEPSGDEPPGDDPPGDEPPSDEPPGDEPPGDEPPGDEPPGDEPPGDEPPGDEPPGDEPPGDDPPGDEPPGDEPPGDEPPGDDPPGDEPPGDEPPGDEPPGDEPPSDEPPGDEPPGDEPPGDEPPGDEPPGDEPPGDEPLVVGIGISEPDCVDERPARAKVIITLTPTGGQAPYRYLFDTAQTFELTYNAEQGVTRDVGVRSADNQSWQQTITLNPIDCS